MDDTSIVDLYMQRDETAIAETTDKYGSRLRALANRLLTDSSAAEECENDTYLSAWNSIPPHEPRTYLFAFLAKITRHHALDFCRSRNRMKRSTVQAELSDELLECIPSKENVEDEIDGTLLGETINRYLYSLKDEQRNIFLRRYWFFDSVADIAKRFQISESKAKSVLFRCRKGLKQHLENV